MEEILHRCIGCLSHYLSAFNHPFGGAGFLPSTVRCQDFFSKHVDLTPQDGEQSSALQPQGPAEGPKGGLFSESAVPSS